MKAIWRKYNLCKEKKNFKTISINILKEITKEKQEQNPTIKTENKKDFLEIKNMARR